MKHAFTLRFAISLSLAFLLFASLAGAQNRARQRSAKRAEQQTQAQPEPPQTDSNGQGEGKPFSTTSTFGKELAEASREAAHEDEENAQFKQSASVRWLGNLLGLSTTGAYWLAFVLNFAVLALAIVWALRSRLPVVFRSRTSSIQKAIEEARQAGADANRRLANIEAQLSRLDAEISAMRQQAEDDAAAEEQKILASVEEEQRKIIDAAEQEIAAAAKLARRELTSYAAGLAVSLAEKQMRIDRNTDEMLVRSFAEELGNGFKGPRKDGR
jgi:F-type H+-transporting ATPase subunit b